MTLIRGQGYDHSQDFSHNCSMISQLPLSDRAFLVAWSRDKRRITGRSELAHQVTAAVLVELWLAGLITDEKGKVVPGSGHPLDPVQAAVLARISGSKPRSWKYWVKKDAKHTQTSVRDRLETARLIKVEQRSLFGLSRKHVSVRDPQVVRSLVRHCQHAAFGSDPATKVDILDAALVAIVAATELNTVFSGKERRTHRVRIAEFAARGGPALEALRSVVVDDQAAAASAGG